MAIVKTTYESGAVAYEHVESLVQTGVYMFRFYGKNDFFDREVNKGDQIEVLGDKVVAYAANCPDVTIPDESEEEEFKLGLFSDHLIAMRAEEAIKEVIKNLNDKNANAEYLKESEKSKDNADESDAEKNKKLFDLCKSLALVVDQERCFLSRNRAGSDASYLYLSNRKEKLVNKIASLFDVE